MYRLQACSASSAIAESKENEDEELAAKASTLNLDEELPGLIY